MAGTMGQELKSDYTRWREPLFSALDPRRYTLAYVDRMVRHGTYLCDSCEDAAILTEARVWPTGMWEVWGVCAAGSISSIRDVLVPLAEQRALAHGAAGSVINSRPAWQKLMARAGYEPYKVEIRKALAL